MIKATWKIKNEVWKGEVFEGEREFDLLSDLEHFLAYNRADILELKLQGTLKIGE